MKLGELLSLHKKAQFYIVSGNHDFDGVIKEYSRSGYNIARITQKTTTKKQNKKNDVFWPLQRNIV